MSDQQQQSPNDRSPLFQRRQQPYRLQRASISSPIYQHQNHIQFISSSPLPNPRQLFPDNSRTRRAFHPTSGGAGTPYGAINTNPTKANVSRANSMNYQQGYSIPGSGTPKHKQIPLRTTKVSQKLVMLPEDQIDEDDTELLEGTYSDQIMDSFRDEVDFRGKGRGPRGRAHTQSELMTKEQRNIRGLARVVAYCTADGYDIKKLSAYLKANHGVYPRLYDEALYSAYHFPLVPGKTTQFMSGPPLRSPGGGSILDKQLEHYEDNTGGDYTHHESSEVEAFRRSNSGHDLANEEYQQQLQNQADAIASKNGGKRLKHRRHGSRSSRHTQDDNGLSITDQDTSASTAIEHQQDYFSGEAQAHSEAAGEQAAAGAGSNGETIFTPTHHQAPFMGGEVFFFDYGVTVFWNFTVEQEAWILDDIAQFEIKKLLPEDVQTEEFHFEYAGYSTPRIYNDMITLKGGNHMIKLTISHAISQSVKLALYECQMDDTIDDTKIIPIQLAQTGKLNYSRAQITRISGHLFQLRMNVDLVSNVLDTPEIFWSEPELQPLYDAIRGYLEIGQRAKVLSDRCLVISDLLTMLRDDLASNNMNYITWIIIILIVIAVIVAAGEIVVKYLSHFGSEGTESPF
ncbi:hypothetical protein FBU30_010607 [Linnemannia zychae]|nr:hypothetical protein FBU30_010607 [Linnemannia zychae]